MEPDELRIGIDGGGTHCRATLFSPMGEIVTTAQCGAANVARDPSAAKKAIVQATQQVLTQAGLDPRVHIQQVHVSAGLAGYGVHAAQQQVMRWDHPFASWFATTDIHAATMGAHNGDNGAVLIVGTGSCAAAYNAGQLQQIGGHGFLLGDKGSGAWLGHQAIRLALQYEDGAVNEDYAVIYEQVLKHFEVSTATMLVNRLIHATPTTLATMAPVIVALASAGNMAAIKLVDEGLNYLVSIALRAVSFSGGNLCLVGGLGSALKPWFTAQHNISFSEAKHGPEWGALLCAQFAKKLAQSTL